MGPTTWAQGDDRRTGRCHQALGEHAAARATFERSWWATVIWHDLAGLTARQTFAGTARRGGA